MAIASEKFGSGGAMYTHDVNGDGLNDVITSLLLMATAAWFEQVKQDGKITFKQHDITGKTAQTILRRGLLPSRTRSIWSIWIRTG